MSLFNNTEDKTASPLYVMQGDQDIPSSILFYGEVTDTKCMDLVKTLVFLDTRAQLTKKQNESYTVLPISLHVQSTGGTLMPSFYVCDVIKSLDTPVNTYVDGFAGSAASLIASCGKKKYMTKHSIILIHQLSAQFGGKYKEMHDNINNLELFMNNLKDIYLENTKIKPDILEDLLGKDVWLPAQKCLEYGLVDEII
tara:strand:- start:17 stop:607 length:591 start_codon:yes stop_codon:yes gene_type:complete